MAAGNTRRARKVILGGEAEGSGRACEAADYTRIRRPADRRYGEAEQVTGAGKRRLYQPCWQVSVQNRMSLLLYGKATRCCGSADLANPSSAWQTTRAAMRMTGRERVAYRGDADAD